MRRIVNASAGSNAVDRQNHITIKLCGKSQAWPEACLRRHQLQAGNLSYACHKNSRATCFPWRETAWSSLVKHIETDQRANLVGSFWMVVSMALFTIEDALLKSASATVPIAQVLIWFGLGGAMAFACVAMLNHQRLLCRDVLSRPMLSRFIFEIFGRLFYVLAIALTPLSAATVILQATPVFVVAGAAFVFGEKATWLRWAAILLGLVGVVVVIRPDANGFSFLSILAVIGMLGFAARDLASRAAPLSLAISTLGFYGFLSIVAAGAIYSVREQSPFVCPSGTACSYLMGAALVGAVAYSALMKAMRTGEVSAVTPFRYTRLIFGIGMGVMLFREHLDVSMLIGCLFIVSSGLTVLFSQAKSPQQ